MKFFEKIKTNFLIVAILAVFTGATTSCEDFFENEGDCEVTHVVKFVYNKNLKWADAFASEVKSVNLYVFDQNGIFVKEYTDSGKALTDPDYHILLDLPVGDYKFLAWCGLENDTDEESFTVPTPEAGVTTIQEMTCALNTQKNSIYTRADQEPVYSNKELYFMFYGYLEANLEDNHDGSRYVHTIELTKDTNHIRIILQELNGTDMNPDDYEVIIEDNNGLLNWNNLPIGSTQITYEPWSQVDDEVGIGRIDILDGSIKYVKGLVVDLSVNRLMTSRQDDLMLTIKNTANHEIICRVPLIQYALMSKKYYESAYGHAMTDQEFLDREDEYIMTFFMFNNRWMDAYIDILQWRILIHEYNLK